jgi:ubiquinone/menaquinone biosynthesis C-methylase UbiE
MADQLFDEWPETYERWFQTPVGKRVRSIEMGHIMDLLAPRRHERILDVGCGTGIFTERYLQQGAHVTGVDLSLEMLRYGRRKAGLGAMLPVVADMHRLPFADGAFDKTVSITALEFAADGRRAVQELLRVTRRGGRLVIATLNRLSSWADRRRQAAQKDSGSVFRHVHFRSPEQLSRLVGLEGEIRTAIHFDKAASPEQAAAEEALSQAAASDRGAFVIGAWSRP